MSGSDVSVLLSHHLKALKLQVFLREYQKVAAHCAREKSDSARFLLELSELELIEREKKSTERRIREAGLPVLKTLDSFDFKALPSLNKQLVMELARCEYIKKRENLLAVGNPAKAGHRQDLYGHSSRSLSLSGGLPGEILHRRRAITALIEAWDDKALLRFKKQLARKELVIVDEFGYVPFSKTGAELLFEFFAERYERASVMVTSNLLFD